MATAGNGADPYQSGGVGGKFRKRPIRRSAQATPYDRPPNALRNNNPSLFARLVDPASKLVYAGADRLFGVFRRRLPSIAAQLPRETSEETRNGLQEAGPNNCTGVSESSTDEGRNLSSVSADNEISELENMLKQKTFTRAEIEHLTALLHSRTTESDVDVGDRLKIPSTTSHLLSLEPSTSGPLNEHVEERGNLHTAILTPVVNSKAFEEDVASPAELAKAYMGTRPSKASLLTLRLGSQASRQDSVLLNNTTILPGSPIISLVPRTVGNFKGFENGLTTPRSRGRSAIYNMARTPYYRGPSTLSQNGIKSDYGHGMGSPSLALSSPAWEHKGSIGSSNMALKRRSSALDDVGSGGPMRRIRQKANLLTQGSSLSKNRSELRNEPEPKASKAVEESGVTIRHNLGYAPVPMKSSQMASKILEQLERLSPKEKSSGSRLAGTSEKSLTKSTSNMIHVQALGIPKQVDSPKLLPSSQDNQKSDSQHTVWLPDTRESTSQSKDKVEENGPRKFAVPRNVLSSMNGSSTVPVRDNAQIATNTDSALKLPAEPPQKKRAFHMSANEDSLELDDNHSNGHVSIPLVEKKKPGTSVFANEDVSADAPAEVIQASLPEVNTIPGMPEFKKVNDSISLPKTDVRPPGGSVNKQIGFNFPTSLSSTSNTQSAAALSQSTSIPDMIVPPKEATKFPSFGISAKNAEVSPFLVSANEPSGFKPNASPDAKPLGSTSLFTSVKKTDQVQFKKDDNDNGQKPVNMFSKPESLSSASPTMPSASGIFSFGGSTKNSSVTNGTPTSSQFAFASSSSFPASGTKTNKFSSSSSALVFSSGTTAVSLPITTTSASGSLFSTSMPTPIFGSGSAIFSSTSASVALTSVTQALETDAMKDKESKSDKITSSLFASTTSFGTASTGGSIVATSTTIDHSQGSFFNSSSVFQANTQAVPFKFGSSSSSLASGTTGIPSTTGSSLFGSSAPGFSSAPSFGFNSTAASSEIKSGSSTTNVFGSAIGSTPSFGLSSSVASSETKSGSSASSSTTNIFGSSWQSPKYSAFGSTFGSPSTSFSFGASSTSLPSASSSPIVFGSSSTGASTGSSMFSFTATAATNSSFPPPSPGQPIFGGATASPINNDQMSMEDSMAEDSMHTQSPVPAFGQAPTGTPGFMFGSATPTTSPVPFQFGGQTNQPPSQNPFQASVSGQTNQPPSQNPFQVSGSAEFKAGGSFSLGSGGGDKSGRRILRVNKSKNRRK